MLVRQVNDKFCAEIQNQYIGGVGAGVTVRREAEIADIFETRESLEWRGLGEIPDSALRLLDSYAQFDAERRFTIVTRPRERYRLRMWRHFAGRETPARSQAIGAACTPDMPMGACMVSSEGSCAAYWAYGRFRDRETGFQRVGTP